MTAGTERTGFFKVRCDLYDEVTFQLSARASEQLSEFLPIAISSKASIREGLEAVRRSPFRTVFVVDLEARKPIFAISQNVDFVNRTRRKGGGGGTPLPPDPITECCNECISKGASGCLLLENMDCWCLYDDGGRDGGSDINDPLETLPSSL